MHLQGDNPKAILRQQSSYKVGVSANSRWDYYCLMIVERLNSTNSLVLRWCFNRRSEKKITFADDHGDAISEVYFNSSLMLLFSVVVFLLSMSHSFFFTMVSAGFFCWTFTLFSFKHDSENGWPQELLCCRINTINNIFIIFCIIASFFLIGFCYRQTILRKELLIVLFTQPTLSHDTLYIYAVLCFRCLLCHCVLMSWYRGKYSHSLQWAH